MKTKYTNKRIYTNKRTYTNKKNYTNKRSKIWDRFVSGEQIPPLRLGLVVFCLVFGLCGCHLAETGSKVDEDGIRVEEAEGVLCASCDLFAMDTYMNITCYGENAREAVKESMEEIHRLDELLSVGNPDSEISRLNESGSETVSADTASMVETSLDLYRNTQGAYDITIYPLMQLWGFTSGNYHVPDASELDSVRNNIGMDRLSYDPRNLLLTLGEGQGIDLGGIAKGYASDRLMEIFRQHSLKAGLVSLGGNVFCYRSKIDGSLWNCGIQDPTKPQNPSAFLGILSVADRAVITSGGYQRYFTDEASGKTYHHILDPKTGRTAESGLLSATIVSPNGEKADGLSTACFVMGLEDAAKYWQEYGTDFEMILMTEDKEVYITEGLKDCFRSDYPVHIIEKS